MGLEPSADAPLDAPRRKVLYVEDNPANLILVEQLIARRSDLKLLTAIDAHLGIDLAGAIRHVREQVGHTTHIEVEVDRLDQIPAVLAGGADTIMLDNFSLDDTRRGVELIDGKAIVEASGNMSLERVPAVAVTGVDVISVGALTHSVRSIDLGLDWN